MGSELINGNNELKAEFKFSPETRILTIKNQVEQEEYYMDRRPSSSSKLVKKGREHILQKLELKSVLTNLRLSSDFIYVAYCALANTAIQHKISGLQYELLKLCKETSISVGVMVLNTESIVNTIISTYKSLLRGKDERAMATLQSCSEYASEMSAQAQKIANSFSVLANKSEEVLEESQAEENKKSQEFIELERKRKETEAILAGKKVAAQEYAKELSKLDREIERAQERADKAGNKALACALLGGITACFGAGISAYGSSMMRQTANANNTNRSTPTPANQECPQENANKNKAENVGKTEETVKTEDAGKVEKTETKRAPEKSEAEKKEDAAKMMAAGDALSTLSDSTKEMDNNAANTAQTAQDQVNKLIDMQNDFRMKQIDALAAMDEFALKIQNFESAKDQTGTAIKMLHLAVSCLKQVVSALINSSFFWESMASYCSNLSKQNLKFEIEDMKEVIESQDPDILFSIYICVSYLCEWTALNEICSEYQSEANSVFALTSENLLSNPSIEEAIAQAPQLADKFRSYISEEINLLKQE